MRKVSEQEWESRREAVARLESSGLGAAEFCRLEGIAYGRMAAWRRRLAGVGAAPGGRGACRGKGGPEAPLFAELVLSGRDAGTGEARAAGPGQGAALVEIELPGGARVRCFEGAGAALVRAAVEAARC